MKRAWVLAAAGVGAVGAVVAAAAVWAPRVLQPAGARAELGRLMARAIDEVVPGVREISVPEDAEPAVFAAQDEASFVPLAETAGEELKLGIPVKGTEFTLRSPPAVCVEQGQFQDQFQKQGIGQAGTRFQVVVCRVGEKRAELNMLKQGLLKKG